MTADANVINESSTAESPEERSAGPLEAGHEAAEQPPTQPRAWSMPKAPVNRKQVDDFGRLTGKAVMVIGKALINAVTAIAKAVASVARYGARAIAQIWRAIEGVPAALQLLSVVAVLMLAGVVGSIALAGTAGLICAVVVVPVCSITLGALGHRWFSSQGQPAAPQVGTRSGRVEASDLERSVTYVDKKLTVALNSLGSDRHQQAVIALFQAKTAVELALGTEQDDENHDDAPIHVDAYRARPRIQAGPKTAMSESNSLAAS